MAVVIEDGTGLANATSFVTVAQYTTWAEGRGYAVPSDVEQAINKSIDYIKSVETEFGGDRAFPDVQALPFPRINLDIRGVTWEETDPVTPIPVAVRELQFAVIKALADGIDLFPTTAERAVKRKKTGALETEWFDADTSPTTPFIAAAMIPLGGSSGQFALTVRRI